MEGKEVLSFMKTPSDKKGSSIYAMERTVVLLSFAETIRATKFFLEQVHLL